MENGIGKIIRVMGKSIIFLGTIGSFIIGIFVADDYDDGLTGLFYFLVALISTFFSGMLILGFSEVIFLLEEISSNSKKTNTDVPKIESGKDRPHTISAFETEQILGDWIMDNYEPGVKLSFQSNNERITASFNDIIFNVIKENECYYLNRNNNNVYKIETAANADTLHLISQTNFAEILNFHRVK